MQLGLCPPCSTHRFRSWIAFSRLPALYLLALWPSFLPSWLASLSWQTSLSWWAGEALGLASLLLPFPSLSFSPLLTHGVCWLPLFISPCLCASHSFLRFALIHPVFAAFLFFLPLLFCCFASLYPCFLHTCSLKAFCSGFTLPTSSLYLFQSFLCPSDLAVTLLEIVTNRTLICVTGWRNCNVYRSLFTMDIFICSL